MAPKGILVTRNICVGGRWDDIEATARPGVTFKDNLLDQDPLFVNAKKLNFNLKPESPAWKLGFKPIPIEKIGLYKDPLRASWPVKTTVRPVPKQAASPSRVFPPAAVDKVSKAPVIDGKITSGEWPEKTITLQEESSRAKIQGQPAIAHLAHDYNSLYVSITVPINKPELAKLGSGWGYDDGAEVCFRPADKNTAAFVLHGFAGGGFKSDPQAGISPEAADALGKVTRFAAKINNGNWTGEWAIQLSGAGIKYKPGLKLAFNMGVWRNETSEWIIWSGAMGATWKLENGGILILR
jgi:hypothetical protein